MTDQPTNKNFLQPNRFKFSLARLPNFEFFVHGLSFPSFGTPGIKSPTPLGSLNLVPSKAVFEDLTVQFKVNEDMSTYTDVFDWMIALGRPINFDGYQRLEANGPASEHGLQSEASVVFLSNQGVPKIRFDFHDLEPVDLKGFSVAYDMSSNQVLVSSVTFKYRDFDYTRAL